MTRVGQTIKTSSDLPSTSVTSVYSVVWGHSVGGEGWGIPAGSGEIQLGSPFVNPVDLVLLLWVISVHRKFLNIFKV